MLVPTGAPPGGPTPAAVAADVTLDGWLAIGSAAPGGPGQARFAGPAELSAAVRLAAGGAPLPPDAAWADVTYDAIPFALLRMAWQAVMEQHAALAQAASAAAAAAVMAAPPPPRPRPPPPPPPPPPAPPPASHAPPPTIAVPPPDSPQWVRCSRCRVWRAVPVGAAIVADPARPGLWVCEWAGWDLAGAHPFTGACLSGGGGAAQ